MEHGSKAPKFIMRAEGTFKTALFGSTIFGLIIFWTCFLATNVVTNFDPEIKMHLRMEFDSGVGPTCLDSVLYIKSGKFGSIDLVWYI